MADTSTAWTVGGNGRIFKTLNGGANWSPQHTGINEFLNGVSAVGPTTAWAVGDGGTILKTTNGTDWSPQATPSSNHLNDVAAVSGTYAWAVGQNGTILRTQDGNSWQVQSSPTPNDLNAVCAVDHTHAWAVGDGGVILKTADGNNWATQTSNTFNDLNGVCAIDQDTAWAVGDGGTILKTTVGSGWIKQTVPDTTRRLTAVAAVDSNTVYAVGYRDRSISQDPDFGTYEAALDNMGIIDFLFNDKDALKYYQRLAGPGLGGELFKNAASIPVKNMVSVTSTTYPEDVNTLEKHLFEMGDGSLLLGLWNSSPSTDDRDVTLAFTLKIPSRNGSDACFENPSKVDLTNGATNEPLPGIVGVDGNGDMAISNLTVGKTPVVLKFPAKSAAPLSVYSVKPAYAPRGTEVTIDGNKFGATRGTSYVSFGTTQVTEYTGWSNTEIKCKVPSGLASGKYPVSVTTTAGTSNQVELAVDFPVDSIEPIGGAPDTNVNISNLAGDGFKDGAKVRLELNEQTVVTATNVNVVSDTQITCTFNLSEVAEDVYDVVVDNPDDTQGRLVDGFGVSAACGSGAAASVMALGVMLGLMSLAGAGSLRKRLRKRPC